MSFIFEKLVAYVLKRFFDYGQKTQNEVGGILHSYKFMLDKLIASQVKFMFLKKILSHVVRESLFYNFVIINMHFTPFKSLATSLLQPSKQAIIFNHRFFNTIVYIYMQSTYINYHLILPSSRKHITIQRNKTWRILDLWVTLLALDPLIMVIS